MARVLTNAPPAVPAKEAAAIERGPLTRRQHSLARTRRENETRSLLLQLHDDVLDNANTRRGLRALNLEVGNKLAILAGDFLLARASGAPARPTAAPTRSRWTQSETASPIPSFR